MDREKLEEQNGWWFTGKVPEELLQKYKRALYKKLYGSLHKRQILSIVGLRRTGKTTLMFQLIEKLLEGGTEKTSILYFNFDEFVESLDDLLATYREAKKKDFREQKVFVFLDEIQKLENWPNQIKKFYDLYPKIKFVISGSESLFISTKTREHLAGRLYEFTLMPLSFKEYLGIRGFEPNLPAAKLRSLFLEYLENGGFPEMAGKSRAEVNEYVKSVVLDKIIFKDIVKLFGVRDTDSLRQLIEIIAANPGIYLEYNSLAKQLGIDRRSVRNYVILLKESFLIKILGNYRRGRAASLRKIKRAYPTDSSIIFLFKPMVDEQFIGRIVETVVINSMSSNSFWRNSHEVDFVADGVPIEVKHQNKIIDKDYEGLREFMRKFSVEKGVLLTKNNEEKIKVPEGKIELVPVWKFLLES